MNTINLLVNNAASATHASGKAAEGAPDGTDFSASLHSASRAPGLLAGDKPTTAPIAPGTEGAPVLGDPGHHANPLLARLQAARLLPAGAADKDKADTAPQHSDVPEVTLVPGLTLLTATVPAATLAGATSTSGGSHALIGADPRTAHGATAPTPAHTTDAAVTGNHPAQGALAAAGSNQPQAHGQPPAASLAAAANTARTTANGSDASSPRLSSTAAAIAAAAERTKAGNSGSPAVATAPSLAALDKLSGQHADSAPSRLVDGTNTASLPGLANGSQASATTGKPSVVFTSATLQAPIGSPGWQQDLGNQLIRMTQRGEQHMELHLHPRELGPLQISLRLDQHSAQAQFLVSHAQVRDAVQQAIPQLREALAGQGIALGEAMVGQQQQQQQQQHTEGFGEQRARGSAVSAIDNVDTASVPTMHTRTIHVAHAGGGVDLYA